MATAAVAAAFCALVLHTLVYAAFLEDPLTWVLLADRRGAAAGPGAVAPRGAGRGAASAVPTVTPSYPLAVLHPRRRPKAFMAAVVATLLLLGGAAAAAYLLVLKSPGDISNPDVPFVAPEPTPAAEARQEEEGQAGELPLADLRLHGRPPARVRPGQARPRARGGSSGSTAPRR